jgi:hypothetical protein
MIAGGRRRLFLREADGLKRQPSRRGRGPIRNGRSIARKRCVPTHPACILPAMTEGACQSVSACAVELPDDEGSRSRTILRPRAGRHRPLLAVSLLCLIGPNFEAAAADSTSRPKCPEPPDRFVAERLGVWQQRLGLAQWKFSVVFSLPSELRPNTVGNIRWDAAEKSAVIRILAASEYELDCQDALRDMEFTIVHEMLHLKVSVLPRCDAIRQDEESAVNDLTRALLMLDRKGADRTVK